MKKFYFLILLLPPTVFEGGHFAFANPLKEHVETEDVIGDHRIRLLEARISVTRAQFLEARFEVEGGGPEDSIFVRFPAHSFTAHERKLMNAVNSSVDWKTPASPHEWHKASRELIFSTPKNAMGYVTDFSKWRIISTADSPPREDA